MDWLEEVVRDDEDGSVWFYVQAQPAAGKTRILGRHGDALKVSVAAPPVAGRANEELVRFLENSLGVGEGNVKLSEGATRRKKRIRVTGIDKGSAVRLLRAAAAPGRRRY